MIDQNKIQYMIDDEVKASKEYSDLAKDRDLTQAQRKKLMQISRQESEHARFWKSMQ